MSGRYQSRSSSSQRQYRGIRMRRWGKWVSEIREPSTRTRIWLGSFRSAEEAAHAYDAALVCIKGRNAQLNFPNHAPIIPRGTPGRYTTREIQAAAAASAAASVGRPFSYSDFLSPESSDTSDTADTEDLEDITYTEPTSSYSHQQQPPITPSNNVSYYNSSSSSWSNAGPQFDDPFEREWVNSMIYPPGPRVDSDDDDSSFVEPSLWSYRR
ncbi:unnamed protein product [Sphagnum compactum]